MSSASSWKLTDLWLEFWLESHPVPNKRPYFDHLDSGRRSEDFGQRSRMRASEPVDHTQRRRGRRHSLHGDRWIGMRLLSLGAFISRRVLIPRHVSPRSVNENILHLCSRKAFT